MPPTVSEAVCGRNQGATLRFAGGMRDWTSGQESGMDSTRVVAVDVGGTFTDVCVLDQASGELAVAKVASTADPIDGVMAGVEQAGVDLSNIALFCHGTTVATNALITRKLPKAAMVCTRGFRDVVEIGRGTRDDLWDAYKDNAEPYIRRRDRLEVTRARRPPRRGGHRARRGRGPRRGAHPRPPRGRDRRGLLRQRLRQRRPRAADGRDPARGAARRDDLDVVRRAAGALRARALLDHGRQRGPVAAGVGLRQPARSGA